MRHSRANGHGDKRTKHGRVWAAGHELCTMRIEEDWCVVVNDVVVDRISNKFDALDLVRNLARGLESQARKANGLRPRSSVWASMAASAL